MTCLSELNEFIYINHLLKNFKLLEFECQKYINLKAIKTAEKLCSSKLNV